MTSLRLQSWVGFRSAVTVAAAGLPAAANPILSREDFAFSLDQAALTVCELRKSQAMDYKLALNTSATPVFQLVKFRYGKRIEGVKRVPADQGLIRYLGIKISELSLKYCPKQLPASVSKEIAAIKSKLN